MTELQIQYCLSCLLLNSVLLFVTEKLLTEIELHMWFGLTRSFYKTKNILL